MQKSNKNFDYFAAIILLLIAALSYYLAPKTGNFSYSDAPRHALNGVFILDYLTTLPIRAPMAYANAYYEHFPALTIGFYPPLLSVVMAGFYAVFGVSHASAQLCISTFLFGLGIGSYILAKRTLGPLSSLAVAILTVTAPVVNNWGQQVMLDVPASFFVVWSAIYFCKWLEQTDSRSFFCAIAFFIAGLYTKQTIAFFMLSALATLLFRKQIKLIFTKYNVIILTLSAISLIPLAALTYVFGRVNMESTLGARAEDLDTFSTEAWTYYLNCLPQSIGCPTTVLGLAGIIYTIIKWRDIQKATPDPLLLLTWIIFGYIFYSLIALRIPRNLVQLAFPFAYFSILTINNTFKLANQKLAPYATIALSLITIYIGLIDNKVQWVDGYQEAAVFSQQHTPKGKQILFHGNRDGSFIYNVRVIGGTHSPHIVRSDKLFLKLKIERERGVQDLGVSEDDMVKMLLGNNISTVVAQKDFWTDLPSMSRFQNLLNNENLFKKIKSFKVNSNLKAEDKELIIYELINI